MEEIGPRLIIAVLVVAGLLALLVIVLRLFGSRLGIAATSSGGKSRLTVIETKFLDARHRICLIGRDDETEHLVILGGNEPVVVETVRKKG